MQWMVLEIKQSKLDDSNILSMLEYQLKMREQELLRHTKRSVVGEMEMRLGENISNTYIIKKGNDKFLDLIDSV